MASADRVSVLLSVFLSVFEPHREAEYALRCEEVLVFVEYWLFTGKLVRFGLSHWLEYLVPLVVLADQLFLLRIK